jgi:hypothetical protein
MIGSPAWTSWVQDCWEQTDLPGNVHGTSRPTVTCFIWIKWNVVLSYRVNAHVRDTHTCVMLIWWGISPLHCKNSSDVTHFVTEAYAHVVSIHYQFATMSVWLMKYVCIYIYHYINIWDTHIYLIIYIVYKTLMYILCIQTLECIRKDQYISVKQRTFLSLQASAKKQTRTAPFWVIKAASGGNSLPTFRDNLSVTSSRVENDSWPWKMVLFTFEDVIDRFSWSVCKNLPLLGA